MDLMKTTDAAQERPATTASKLGNQPRMWATSTSTSRPTNARMTATHCRLRIFSFSRMRAKSTTQKGMV